MLNSKHLSLVNKIGDKTEFTITRVHCILKYYIQLLDPHTELDNLISTELDNCLISTELDSEISTQLDNCQISTQLDKINFT